jgi:hypothetical protein
MLASLGYVTLCLLAVAAAIRAIAAAIRAFRAVEHEILLAVLVGEALQAELGFLKKERRKNSLEK